MKKSGLEGTMDLVIDKETGYYLRSWSSDREVACNMIKKLYGGEKTFLFASGMNAIYCVLNTVAEEMQEEMTTTGGNKSFLVSDEMYTDSKNKVLRTLKKKYPNFTWVTFKYKKQNFKTLLKQYQRTLACVFFEASSNPTSRMVDFSGLEDVPEKCYVVLDNTWLTPLAFQPFKFRINCCVDSCSKYLSAGKCIAGHATFKKALDPIATRISAMIRLMGIHVSPIHCQLIQTGIKSLRKNVKIISDRTVKIVNILSKNSNVIEISHPMLKTHPTHDLYEKFVNREEFAMPGVIWFHVKASKDILNDKKEWKNRLGRIIKKHKVRYSTSFGKPYHLIDMWPKKEKNTSIWLRLSIGYGDEHTAEDLKDPLEKILHDVASWQASWKTDGK